MVIPKSFKLYNQTIKVIYSRTLIDKHQAYGLWLPLKNTIYLQQSTRKYKLTKEQIESCFYHETLHACLDLMGEEKLSSNERLVSGLSQLLHQFIEQI